jgi:cation/acetate symporter
MSAASFIGMAGTLYALGYDGLAFILGWTGGYVLVATLIAPYLRKFGCYTVPDFLAFRFGGNGARIMGIIVLMSCSFTYVVAQIVGTGLIGAACSACRSRSRSSWAWSASWSAPCSAACAP